MKQKSSRVLTEKTENASAGNAQAQGENVFCPKAPTEKRFANKRTEADTRGPHVRFEKLAGARRLRWTPASNHGELGGSEGTKSFSLFFRVGGWWTRPTGSTTSTATLSPADGGSGDGGELRWRAANFELKRGSVGGMHSEVTGKKGRQRCTHGSESSWIPWRVAAAGVEEGDLLEALPVARRALEEVQGWWVLELKLGTSIYRWINGVAVNGESPASNYRDAVDWQEV